MTFVYLNGDFIPEQQARISVFDQGFLYGDGIYECFRSVAGRLYRFPQHFARLRQSAEALRYPLRFGERELEGVLLDLQARNGLWNAYFRINLSRGEGQIGFARPLSTDPTCLILAREFQGLDEKLYREGIALKVAATRRNAPEAISPKIKSISNLNSLLGKLEAREAGVPEVIMLNNRGHVCEGAASNIFWTRGQYVFTPDVSTGLLEGVTRSTLMRLCEAKLGLRVIPGQYRLQDLLYSDEVFISSTSLEVMPVVRVEDSRIAEGQVGPVARHLREALHRDMEEGTPDAP